MSDEKDVLAKSRDALADSAVDVADLAKAQRANADKQHENAHKLEDIGHALEEDAAELTREINAGAVPASGRNGKKLVQLAAAAEMAIAAGVRK